MNLQEMLNNGRINCFKMAEQEYYETYNNSLMTCINSSIHERNNSITHNFYGAQLALIAEYYLKGILLPVLEITIPEDDEKLKQIAQKLTDEQKYRIISSDALIISELQNLYGDTGISGRSIVSKLGKESLQKYGHDLNLLIAKIIEKAENGKFRDSYIKEYEEKLIKGQSRQKTSYDLYSDILMNRVENENIKSYVSDSYIKSVFTRLLEDTSSATVKKAFPEGRYGYLNEYVADIKVLRKVVNEIRNHTKEISPGVEIILAERDEVRPRDKYIEFIEKLKSITIYDANDNAFRIFEWKNGNLELKYGIEKNDKIRLENNPLKLLEENVIFIKPGEQIQFLYEDGKTKNYHTRHGKIENGDISYKFDSIYINEAIPKKEPQYYSEILAKSKVNIERSLVDNAFSGELTENRLVTKYETYMESYFRLANIKRVTKLLGIPKQKNQKLYKILHKQKLEEDRRYSSEEFRKAYIKYLGDKYSYKIEKGRQIFMEMMNYIKKGNLKSETLSILKEVYKKNKSEDIEER